MQSTARFNFASALSGFAIGAVVTFMAVIAFVPDGRRGSSGTTVATGDFAAGDESYLDEEGAPVDTVLDAQGNVVALGARRATGTGGGSAASAAGTTGGAATGAGGSRTPAGRSTATTIPGRAGGSTGSGSNLSGGTSGGSASGSTGGSGGPVACAAGRNGGVTDTGVTATQIKLGATIAESGIAKSFLGQVRQGMEAQVKKVNRAGGVCGRQLKVIYKDDGWNAETGARYIQNLVEGEKVFALAVSPSSEGLNQASNQGYFRQQGVPVVGADGLNATQFKDPMIWPVAAATTTTIDVMMKNAADRLGAQNLRPAIVFGNTYRFGVEGAFAANEAYKKIAGRDIEGYKNPLTAGGGGCEKRFCGVSAGQGQYGNQVSVVKQSCADSCNFMILLLEPKTAQDWMAVPGVMTPSNSLSMAGPQPLFTFDFARNCGDKCDGLWLWTGYNPPIDKYQSVPAVSAFVSDLKAQSASADEFNQFTMGGYIGMQLLIEALKQTGPNLTRAGLVDKLNSMAPLDTGLTSPLEWRQDARYANHSAQAFKIESRNGFSGWILAQEPMRDPWLGQHGG